MKKEEKKKLGELLKDKKERAKIELIFYGIFFIAIIIFARFLGGNSNTDVNENNNSIMTSFVSRIEDNYEYDIVVAVNDELYEYYGKVLGNNGTVNLKIDDDIKSYRIMNNKYYILDGDNYILTDEDEVYPYIDYHYLDIDNIREYMELSSVYDNTYRVKVSDIVLDSDSDEYLEINVNEGDLNIVIDYSPVLRLTREDIEKVMVSITYYNIDNIISLDE